VDRTHTELGKRTHYLYSGALKESAGANGGAKKQTMRDIAKEQEIIKWLDKRNKVSPARRKQIQNLGSAPVISTPVSLKKSQGQAGQAGAKPKPIRIPRSEGELDEQYNELKK